MRAKVGEGQLSLLADLLTDRERAVLEFARGPGLRARVADQGQQRLGLSPTRYFQVLGWLLERAEAADAEPELVAALRGVQDQRRQLRRNAPPARRDPGGRQ